MTNRLRRFLFWCWIILAHIALGALVITSSKIRPYCEQIGFCTRAELSATYHSKRTYLKQRADLLREGFALIIGDSHVEALSFELVDPLSLNAGISGDTTFGILNRLDDYEPLEKWRYVIISVGYNDLRFRKPAAVAENLKLILDRFAKESKVFVVSVPPIDETALFPSRRGANEQLRVLNSLLLNIVSSFETVTYIDLFASVSNHDGQLLERMHVGDGVHLNAVGRSVVLCRLKVEIGNHAVPLASKSGRLLCSE